MKKIIKYLKFISLLQLACILNMKSQSTILGNASVSGLEFLGWNNNQIPLRLFTAGTQRMQINQVIPNNITTVAAGTQNTSGFVGINTADPWSRLHIATNNANPYGGYRPWMRDGLTLQSFNDQLWLGHTTWGAVDNKIQLSIGVMMALVVTVLITWFSIILLVVSWDHMLCPV
mgnify:CR=1 FL=1